MKQRDELRLNPLTRQVLLALTGSLLSLAAGAAHGEAAAATDSQLDTVVVSGEKMPRSLSKATTAVTVVGADQLEKGDISSVNELAQKVPNAVVNPAGGINIRGVESTGPATGLYTFFGGARPRVATMLDGVAEAWTGQQYMDADMWDVKQVEVLRGPQSTTQGRNAIGGAVLVQTRDPSFVPEGALRLGWETADGRANAAGMVSGPLVKDELAYRLTAQGVRGNDYIQYAGKTGNDNPSHVQNYDVRGKLLWTPSSMPDFQAKLTLSHRQYQGDYLNQVSNPVSAYTYIASTSNNYRTQDSDNTTATLESQYAFAAGVTGYLQYSFSDNHIGFVQRPTAMTLGMDDQNHTVEGRVVFKRPDSALSGVLGMYLYQRDQDLSAYGAATLSGSDSVKTGAVYGDGEWVLSPAWSLLGGVRVEKEEQQRNIVYNNHRLQADIDKTSLLPKAGVSYRWSDDTNLNFVVRKGYNPGGVLFDTSHNYAVYQYDSESVNSYEAMLKTRWQQLKFSANLFYNDYDNYQMSYSSILYNMPKAHTDGLELGAELPLAGGWELGASIGLLQSRIDQAPSGLGAATGNQLTYAPETTVSASVKRHWGQWESWLNAQYVGKYYTDAANSKTAMGGDYTLVNMGLSYALTHDITLRGYVKNAFNQTLVLGMRTTGFYVGAPRTYGVNAEYRF